MGLFSKKPKIAVCEMCGKAEAEGCGSVHIMSNRLAVTSPCGCQGTFVRRLRVSMRGCVSGVTHTRR